MTKGAPFDGFHKYCHSLMKIHSLSYALLRIFNIFCKDECPLPWRWGILILSWTGNRELPSCFKGEKKITSTAESVERIQRGCIQD